MPRRVSRRPRSRAHPAPRHTGTPPRAAFPVANRLIGRDLMLAEAQQVECEQDRHERLLRGEEGLQANAVGGRIVLKLLNPLLDTGPERVAGHVQQPFVAGQALRPDDDRHQKCREQRRQRNSVVGRRSARSGVLSRRVVLCGAGSGSLNINPHALNSARNATLLQNRSSG